MHGLHGRKLNGSAWRHETCTFVAGSCGIPNLATDICALRKQANWYLKNQSLLLQSCYIHGHVLKRKD